MLHKTYNSVSAATLRVIRSRWCFYGIVLLLAVQAAWIALTARYPQAFDENYHFGLIQLHATQLMPFFTHQPPNTAMYGAIVRDPSYLYQYLLSFPYRLLEHLTTSITIQIIVLRFINIAMFAAGLFAFRKLFAMLGVTRAVSNTVLLFFVLTPFVPLLAGQINYDNLMFPLTGLLFVLLLRFRLQLIERRAVPLGALLGIIIVGSLGSIVTFPYAAIFLPVLLTVVYLVIRHRPAGRFWLVDTATTGRKLVLAGALMLAGISVFLCLERYGLNMLRYHTPVPECGKVLSIDDCQAYAPWARDYQFAATYPRPTLTGILVYPGVWAHRLVYESMFTITSTYWEIVAPANDNVFYYPADPMPIANYTAWAVIIIGAVLAVIFWQRLWQHHALRLLLLISAFYGLVLLVQNFAMYLHTGEAVAIHGRYLVPVYPLLYLVLALGFSWAAERVRWQRCKPALLIVVLLLFLQGAGVVTWISRSESWWYWPQSQAAQRANWLAQDVLHHTVLR